MVTYGRCMSKKEAEAIKKSQQLQDSYSDGVPVFDCPPHIYANLKGRKKKELKEYFRRIGVRSPEVIVFFDVDNPVAAIVGPVPQKNGLKEYKLKNGTKVKIIDKFRLERDQEQVQPKANPNYLPSTHYIQ